MEINQSIDKSIFKSYDIRGIYPAKLNGEIVKEIIPAFIKFLTDKLQVSAKGRSAFGGKSELLNVVIGWDMRIGNDELVESALAVFKKFGVSVTTVGLVPIDYIYFVTGKFNFDGGIMFTASHNPKEYIGLKMLSKGVEPVSGRQLWEMMQKGFDLPKAAGGKTEEADYWKNYLDHVRKFSDPKKLKPLKVVIDAGNGLAGKVIPQLLKDTPLEVIPLFFEIDGNFPNRPSNPLDLEGQRFCREKILETKADLGVMFDGDTDRMFFMDEQGNFIKGDLALLLFAEDALKKNPGAGIVYNVVCSKAVPEFIAQWGGRPIRSEVGYSNLARHMKEENGIMSGEFSAHYAYKDNYYADSGFISLLLALETIGNDGRKLSEIIHEYAKYYSADEMTFKIEDAKKVLAAIKEKYHDAKMDELDGLTVEYDSWWFNARPSNTEPILKVSLLEARTKEEMEKRQQEIREFINQFV